MNLRKIVMVACMVSGVFNGAQAQNAAPAAPTIWFTIMGDPDDAEVNTVQVDPVAPEGMARTKRVRVNRSTWRTSWDGVPYRSYTAVVAFDCEKSKARYLKIAYHDKPQWHGDPVKTVDYSTGPQRWMEFRDVTPNPTQRIINAACSLGPKR